MPVESGSSGYNIGRALQVTCRNGRCRAEGQGARESERDISPTYYQPLSATLSHQQVEDESRSDSRGPRARAISLS